MTDIFREVEEDVRRERFEQLWKKYGDYFVAVAALLVIGAAGFQLWRVYEQRQQAKASETYFVAQQLMDAGQPGIAAQTFAKIAQTAPSGYAQVALMQQANALYAAGNVPEALDLYKQVAAKGDPLLAPVARIRVAWATVETAPRADIQTLLQAQSDPASPWHSAAREVLAYADYHAGDIAAALKEFRALAKDTSATESLRQRSDAMATFLSAGGDADFGTVPRPPKPPIQAAPGPKPQ